MATCLFGHAQEPKSQDLEAIKGKQLTKTLISAMTAALVTSKKKHAMTNHYYATQRED